MLCHQQRKVGVLCLTGRVFIAVAVDGDDTVGILVDHNAMRVHAEGANVILKFLGAVDNLTLV